MHELHEQPRPAAAVKEPEGVPVSERVAFLAIGLVIGIVFEAMLRMALRPVVGPAVSKGIGRGVNVGIALCFMNGYPAPTRRWATTVLPVGIAAGLLGSWLVD